MFIIFKAFIPVLVYVVNVVSDEDAGSNFIANIDLISLTVKCKLIKHEEDR